MTSRGKRTTALYRRTYLLALGILVLAWGCGTRDRHYEACVFATAPQAEVEALFADVMQRTATDGLPTLEAAVESELGGLEARYGEHRLGIYAHPDRRVEGQLRIWCWSTGHPLDADVVRTALVAVLEEESIPHSTPGEGD